MPKKKVLKKGVLKTPAIKGTYLQVFAAERSFWRLNNNNVKERINVVCDLYCNGHGEYFKTGRRKKYKKNIEEIWREADSETAMW